MLDLFFIGGEILPSSFSAPSQRPVTHSVWGCPHTIGVFLHLQHGDWGSAVVLLLAGRSNQIHFTCQYQGGSQNLNPPPKLMRELTLGIWSRLFISNFIYQQINHLVFFQLLIFCLFTIIYFNRSGLSKLVAAEDLGKLNAFVSVVQITTILLSGESN